MDFFFTLFTTFSMLAEATNTASKQLQWWEIATGILAIPAAVVGLIYSIVLIRKTNVEVKKTRLEILEKEASLRKATKNQSDISQELITPIIETKNLQLILFRFILLWLILQLWRFADGLFSSLLGGAFIWAQQYVPFLRDHQWIIILLVFVTNIPKAGEAIILVGLGFPLLRDVSLILGIDPFSLPPLHRKKDKKSK